MPPVRARRLNGSFTVVDAAGQARSTAHGGSVARRELTATQVLRDGGAAGDATDVVCGLSQRRGVVQLNAATAASCAGSAS